MKLYVVLRLFSTSAANIAFCLVTLTCSHLGQSPPTSALIVRPPKLISVPLQGDDLDFGDNVDTATFEQILEMDEDPGDREFSQGIVFDFFGQAETTFADMDTDM